MSLTIEDVEALLAERELTATAASVQAELYAFAAAYGNSNTNFWYV